MKINEKLKLAFILSSLVFVVFFSNSHIQNKSTDMMASVFFVDSIKAEDIIDKYQKAQTSRNRQNNPKVNILIVPGHDDKNSGAYFDGVRESEINLKVAKYLINFLEQEKNINTFLSRDENGYNPSLQEFFIQQTNEITNFYEEKRQIMRDLVAQGLVYEYVNVSHNFAKPEVVNVLYGINKFANDNNFDIVIHIHFNDYAKRKGVGKYSGFSIYIPEKQYSNARASKILAENIYNQLSFLFAESNLPKESGIVEDQELIAVGSNNTADPISLLIEYGYIYESQFHHPEIREIVFEELAYKTFLGITDFLKERFVYSIGFQKLNDYSWQNNLTKGSKGLDVLALQNLLKKLNIYPVNKNLNDCPLNGNFGNCTRDALIIFQEKYGLEKTGIFDLKTMQKANTLNIEARRVEF